MPDKWEKDPARIERILGKFQRAWERVPDMRLCQLLNNMIKRAPLACVEDSVIEARLDSMLPAPEYALRLWDCNDGWTTVKGPCSREEAEKAWIEKTDNGRHSTSYEDMNYYKVVLLEDG